MEYPDLTDNALIDTWLCVSMAFSMIAIISSKILRLNLLEQSIVKPVILLFLLLNASLFLQNQKLPDLLSFEEWHSHTRSNISTHHVAQKIISKVKDADSPLAQDETRKEVVWKNADKPRAPRQKNAGHSQKINSNRYFSRK
ncbi:TPA: hypothetical protein ACKP0H_001557 [Serratia marcescens]